MRNSAKGAQVAVNVDGTEELSTHVEGMETLPGPGIPSAASVQTGGVAVEHVNVIEGSICAQM